MKKLFILALVALTATLQAEPKKLLVVTTTTGFRHASIPTLEKMLSQLAATSGEFTVDFVQQPPGHAPTGFPTKLKADATDDQKAAFAIAEAAWDEKLKSVLQKLSPENLKNYDGVIFASSNDMQAIDRGGSGHITWSGFASQELSQSGPLWDIHHFG